MAMYKAVAALALIAVALADFMDREMYDDTPGDMELMYPEKSYVDMIPEPEAEPPRAEAKPPTTAPRKYEEISNVRKMLLYRMIMALRNHDASPSFLSVPKWMATSTVLVPPDTFNYSPLKGPLGPMFKRSSDGSNQGLRGRPQQKGKIKIGKADSRTLCYFKLCAFHPPRGRGSY